MDSAAQLETEPADQAEAEPAAQPVAQPVAQPAAQPARSPRHTIFLVGMIIGTLVLVGAIVAAVVILVDKDNDDSPPQATTVAPCKSLECLTKADVPNCPTNDIECEQKKKWVENQIREQEKRNKYIEEMERNNSVEYYNQMKANQTKTTDVVGQT